MTYLYYFAQTSSRENILQILNKDLLDNIDSIVYNLVLDEFVEKLIADEELDEKM